MCLAKDADNLVGPMAVSGLYYTTLVHWAAYMHKVHRTLVQRGNYA